MAIQRGQLSINGAKQIQVQSKKEPGIRGMGEIHTLGKADKSIGQDERNQSSSRDAIRK